MRDMIFFVFLAASLAATVRYPFVGVLLWAWFTLATPQQATFYANTLPLNVIIAGIALGAFFLHREWRGVRLTPLFWIALAFTAWLGVSQAFSLVPAQSAPIFDRFWKVMAFVLLCMATVKDRARFHALLWLLVLVMGFFGAKGGIYTIRTLGQHLVFGLESTVLWDNNHLGIALATVLPFFLYLAGRAGHPMLRLALLGTFGLSVATIFGTHSRGAFIALLAFGLVTVWRSRFRYSGLLVGAVFGLAAAALAPDDYSDRMASIGSATEDASFMGRVDAWVINAEAAFANPITGVGLRLPYDQRIADLFTEGRVARAAHSIYFEILGGTGFVGLALFLSLFAWSFLAARRLVREAKREGRTDDWRADFGHHAQTSLIVFALGAASVSLEMWEGYWLVMVLIGAATIIPLKDGVTDRGAAAETLRPYARPWRPSARNLSRR